MTVRRDGRRPFIPTGKKGFAAIPRRLRRGEQRIVCTIAVGARVKNYAFLQAWVFCHFTRQSGELWQFVNRPDDPQRQIARKGFVGRVDGCTGWCDVTHLPTPRGAPRQILVAEARALTAVSSF